MTPARPVKKKTKKIYAVMQSNENVHIITLYHKIIALNKHLLASRRSGRSCWLGVIRRRRRKLAATCPIA